MGVEIDEEQTQCPSEWTRKGTADADDHVSPTHRLESSDECTDDEACRHEEEELDAGIKGSLAIKASLEPDDEKEDEEHTPPLPRPVAVATEVRRNARRRVTRQMRRHEDDEDDAVMKATMKASEEAADRFNALISYEKEIILQKAKDRGYTLFPVTGNGDCQFTSMAKAWNAENCAGLRTCKKARDMRNAAVTWLTHIGTKTDASLYKTVYDTHEKRTEYLDSMNEPKIYGDMHTLWAFMEHFECEVTIVYANDMQDDTYIYGPV